MKAISQIEWAFDPHFPPRMHRLPQPRRYEKMDPFPATTPKGERGR